VAGPDVVRKRGRMRVIPEKEKGAGGNLMTLNEDV
jgi:hypothetical protein